MYDVTIIGAGVAGVFAAHTLARSGKRLLVIDRGKRLSERSCGLDRGEACGCDACDKYVGFGGLGMSEGKYNYTNDFGGDLERKAGAGQTLELMEEVDRILCGYGAGQAELYSTDNPELTRRGREAGFEVLTTKTRHLGTSLSKAVLQRMFEDLERQAAFLFETTVERIRRTAGGGFELTIPGREPVLTERVLLATGRSGNDWLAEQCRSLGIPQNRTRVDLGLRIEMRGNQLDDILRHSFETKLRYAGEDFTATTYCMNPRGRVIRKYQDGLVMPDGQNFREREEGSSNLNFTLFVPKEFAAVREADEYMRAIIGGINAGSGRIAAQRLGDLKRGLASPADLSGGSIRPTIAAEGSDLRKEVPEVYIRAALAFLDALERLLGEPIDGDTLLYGIDGKFYAPRMETSDKFETAVKGLYAIGDCSGVTHSLSQAAASGVYAGRQLNALTTLTI